MVRLVRSGQVACNLLGERFEGILVTDRWSAYNVGGFGCLLILVYDHWQNQ